MSFPRIDIISQLDVDVRRDEICQFLDQDYNIHFVIMQHHCDNVHRFGIVVADGHPKIKIIRVHSDRVADINELTREYYENLGHVPRGNVPSGYWLCPVCGQV